MDREFEHLHNISPVDVMRQLKSYRNLNIEHLTDEELRKALYKALLVNGKFVYLGNQKIHPAGTKFYRARPLSGSTVPFEELSTMSDFWYPPKECVKRIGRLNKEHEPLLYTTVRNPCIPMTEIPLDNGGYYCLNIYCSKGSVTTTVIGGEYDYEKLGIADERIIAINELFNDFLQLEFSRAVGTGTEYLYGVSEMIVKDFFDLPDSVQDAWEYPSIRDKSEFNVCFRPDKADRLLNLERALICRKEDRGGITPVCLVSAEENEFKYFEISHEIISELLPELTKI